ncbi:MAG: hypothetical protein GX684_00105 [Ruminococcaceae bacterium]|nr:hypothetical protein [Oscillospiraceae bacterium]
MKESVPVRDAKKAGNFFAFIAVILALATIVLGILGMKTDPVIFNGSFEKEHIIEDFVDALVKKDYDKAESMLRSGETLGIKEKADTPVGELVLRANLSELKFETEGRPTVDSSAVITQKLNCTYLDVKKLMQDVGELAKSKLQKAVESAENMNEIYDSAGNYKEELVMKLLSDAVTELVGTGNYKISANISIGLVSVGGKWKVVPSEGLYNALFGGTIY